MPNLPKRNVDLTFIYRATERAKDYIAGTLTKAQRLQEDPDKKIRRARGECKSCYYLFGRIGGNVSTSLPCSGCETRLTFSNTCVDVFCLTCAKRLGLCVHCGGDVELKHRRNRTL